MSATRREWENSELQLLNILKRANSGLELTELTKLYNSYVTKDRERSDGAVETRLRKLEAPVELEISMPTQSDIGGQYLMTILPHILQR